MSDEQRTDTGHWPKGVSGNPGGYSTEKRKSAVRVSELARQHTEDAIKTLAAIMMDEKATRVSRIAAANALLDRGYGKPPQSVGIDLSPPDDANAIENRTVSVRRLLFAVASCEVNLRQLGIDMSAEAKAELMSELSRYPALLDRFLAHDFHAALRGLGDERARLQLLSCGKTGLSTVQQPVAIEPAEVPNGDE